MQPNYKKRLRRISNMEKGHIVILFISISLLILMFGLVSWNDARVIDVGSGENLSNAPIFFIGFLIVVVIASLIMLSIGDKL